MNETQHTPESNRGDEHNEASVERFKTVFRRHPARVALVIHPDADAPVGLTVSSLASVSARPPLVSFSISQNASAAMQLLSAPSLHVVLLGEHQSELAAAFATSGAARFTESQGWRRRAGRNDHSCELFLASAPATLHVHATDWIPAGDSWLVLSAVANVEIGPVRAPLIYYNQTYWPEGELPVSGVTANHYAPSTSG